MGIVREKGWVPEKVWERDDNIWRKSWSESSIIIHKTGGIICGEGKVGARARVSPIPVGTSGEEPVTDKMNESPPRWEPSQVSEALPLVEVSTSPAGDVFQEIPKPGEIRKAGEQV